MIILKMCNLLAKNFEKWQKFDKKVWYQGEIGTKMSNFFLSRKTSSKNKKTLQNDFLFCKGGDGFESGGWVSPSVETFCTHFSMVFISLQRMTGPRQKKRDIE